MTQSARRIACPRCGANNFETMTVCWQCGHTLGSDAGAALPRNVSEGNPTPMSTSSHAGLPAMGDLGVAKRAAIALALSFPYFGLPIGWAFMMIEDQRRQAIGRFCVYWSLFGLVLHCVLMFIAAQALGTALMPVMESLVKSRGGAGAGSSGSGVDGVPTP